MSLTLEHFAKAVVPLEEVVARYESDLEDDTLIDALIKRFEFTYELALKMLRRQMQQDTGASTSSFSEVIRWGWTEGLLGEELDIWRQFRENRNRTSHTYNEASAIAVCAEIPRFLAEAKFLLSQLEKRNDDDPLD